MKLLFAVTLTPEQVEQRAQEIRDCADDPEAAHGMEDDLRSVVLESIAINHLSGVDAQLAALYAFSTRDIEFPRWTA